MGSAEDQEVAASRKLTESETSELRKALGEELNLPDGSSAEEEDASDLLDYAFAMIGNGKTVDYVVQEVCLLCVQTQLSLSCFHVSLM